MPEDIWHALSMRPPMPDLDPATVRHVARIARLPLTPEEEARLSREASAILTHFEAVEAARAAPSAPGAGTQVVAGGQADRPAGGDGARAPPRPDAVAGPEPAQADALVAQFPEREGRLCRVPGAL